MTLIQVLIVLAVVGAVAAVAAGVVRGGMADDATSRPGLELPEDALRGSDLTEVRFSLGLRGYRMDEVDDVLDRVAAELDARDAEIAQLREHLARRAAAPQGEEFEATQGGPT